MLCNKCNHSWEYKGISSRATCPKCKLKSKVVNQQESSQVVNEKVVISDKVVKSSQNDYSKNQVNQISAPDGLTFKERIIKVMKANKGLNDSEYLP